MRPRRDALRGAGRRFRNEGLIARPPLKTSRWLAALCGRGRPASAAPGPRMAEPRLRGPTQCWPPLLTLCGWQVTRRLASGRPCWPRGAARAAVRGSPRTGDRPSRAYPGAARPTCQARSRRRGVCGVAIPACPAVRLSAESPPQSPALLLSLKLIRGIRGASVGHRGPHSAHIHDRRCWCCRKSSCSRSLFLLRAILPVRKHFVFFFFFFFF